MSKILFIILFLAGLIAFSWGIACPQNFCDAVKCQKNITLENCQSQNEIYVPNGSFCGCCPVCISTPSIEENQPGDVSVKKLCKYPFIGTGERGYYIC